MFQACHEEKTRKTESAEEIQTSKEASLETTLKKKKQQVRWDKVRQFRGAPAGFFGFIRNALGVSYVDFVLRFT
jgi:hypothetical protein